MIFNLDLSKAIGLYSGLWLSLLFVLPVDQKSLSVFFLATFWMAHRLGSFIVAFFAPSFKQIIKADPIRFVWIPLGLLLLIFIYIVGLDHLNLELAQSRLIDVLILDYFLLTFHFSAQHFGILCLLSNEKSKESRRAFKTLCYGLGGVGILLAEVMNGEAYLPDEWTHLTLIQWIGLHSNSLKTVMAALILSGVLMATFYLKQLGQRAYIYLMSLFLMLFLSLNADPLLFGSVWATQHWMAAVVLAAPVWMPKRPLLALLALCALSILAWPFADTEFLLEGGKSIASLELLPFLKKAFQEQPALLITLATLSTWTGFYHYILDRGIYRLSNPEIKKALQPLFKKPTN